MTGRERNGVKHRGVTRRGVKGTAIAVAAMAALTGSQAPGSVARASAPAEEAAPGPSITGDTPYRTELPPIRPRGGAGPNAARSAVTTGGTLPATVLDAYQRAESALARSHPGCNLRWQLLAAIGQVESGQARGGRVSADGTTLTPILGPQLDGRGFALIRDTDGGAHDGDATYDRAVGPMQFIPSTWAGWGADGNGDGRADPNNIYDAALAAGRYLCAGGRDLSHPDGLDRAILGYNRSGAYLRTVKAWFAYFFEGHRVVPDHGAALTPRPTPDASRPAWPQPSPSTAPARPSGKGGGSTAPSSPAPPPSKTGPGGGQEPAEPALPLPETGVELPGDGVVPLPGAPVGNGKESMRVSPSTTPDTGR